MENLLAVVKAALTDLSFVSVLVLRSCLVLRLAHLMDNELN